MPSRMENTGVHVSLAGVRRGAFKLLPMAALTMPFGIGFGVAAIDAGMSAVQAIAMSALSFSGAAQFAALEFWPDPTALVSIAMVVLALNLRHAVMGAALSPWVNALRLRHRLTTLAVLSDPNFADSQPAFRSGERDIGILLGGGLALWCAWVLGTSIGATGSSVVTQPERFGIDVVMPCFFAAICIGHAARDRAASFPICVAAVLSVLTLDWVPTGWNVIFGAFAGAIAGSFRYAE